MRTSQRRRRSGWSWKFQNSIANSIVVKRRQTDQNSTTLSNFHKTQRANAVTQSTKANLEKNKKIEEQNLVVDEGGMYKCPNTGCDRSYKHKRNMYTHQRLKCEYKSQTNTTKKTGYVCPTVGCERTYKHKSSLEFHLRNECGMTPAFKCPRCPHVGTRKWSVHTHIKRIHGEVVDVNEVILLSVNQPRKVTSKYRVDIATPTFIVNQALFKMILSGRSAEKSTPSTPSAASDKPQKRGRPWKFQSGNSVAKGRKTIEQEILGLEPDATNRYRCPTPGCESSGKSVKYLSHHLRFRCQVPPNFKCPYCPYRTHASTSVRAHIRVVHKNHDVQVIKIKK